MQHEGTFVLDYYFFLERNRLLVRPRMHLLRNARLFQD